MGFFDFLKKAVSAVETQVQPAHQYTSPAPFVDQRLVEQQIAQNMLAYSALPYQICTCRFMDDAKAWAMFNQTNVNALALAIEELNKLIANCDAANQAFRLLVPFVIRVPMHKLKFGYHKDATVGDLPISYFVYQPFTKTGRQTKYPLSVHFSTIGEYHEVLMDECHGDLYYEKDGSITKAKLVYFYNDRCFVYTFGLVGRTFAITKVEIPDYNTGKNALIYSCDWDLIS